MLKQLYYHLLFKSGWRKWQLAHLNKIITENALHHSHYHYYCSAIFTYIGHCHSLLNQSEQATEAYAKAIFQDHENQYATPDNHDQTHEYLEKHKESFSGLTQESHATTLLTKAIACFDLKHYEQSLKNLEQAKIIALKEHDTYHRHSSGLHFRRAYFYFLSKNYDLCVTDLTKALDLYQTNCDALFLRAQLYILRENVSSAIEDYNKILTIRPNSRAAKSGLAAIYGRLALNS